MIGYMLFQSLQMHTLSIRDYDVDKALEAMLHSANHGVGFVNYRKWIYSC